MLSKKERQEIRSMYCEMINLKYFQVYQIEDVGSCSEFKLVHYIDRAQSIAQLYYFVDQNSEQFKHWCALISDLALVLIARYPEQRQHTFLFYALMSGEQTLVEQLVAKAEYQLKDYDYERIAQNRFIFRALAYRSEWQALARFA